MEHIVNERGEYIQDGLISILVSPSEEYNQQRQQEEQRRIEQELLESLKPSEKEILMAEVEINIITLLLEMELI